MATARTARSAIVRGVRRLIRRRGYDLVKHPPAPQVPMDCDLRSAEVIERVRPYTLTTPERIMALRNAIAYLERAAIPGAIVECGVWRGGSMMAAAMTLLELGSTDRDIYLFDTFTEQQPPDERDHHVAGFKCADRYDHERGHADPRFAFLPVEAVGTLLESTGYPSQRLHFVQGLVEDTIPDQAPADVALCRLDTDWYRSTAHEMRHLYPRISPGGVLIVDDYGEFLGARQAVDEHLESDGRPVFLHRVDVSCRLALVPGR